MADAPDPQEQKQEVTRATGSAAATEGAMSHLLHTHERQQQIADVHDQQELAEKTHQKFTPRGHYNSDPIRNQKGPGRAVSSQHAQQGSHGLSGQAPK